MEEFEIIQKLQQLKEIKPRREWVSQTKAQITRERKIWGFLPSFEFKLQPAFAMGALVLLVILGAVFGLMNNSQNPVVTINPNVNFQDPTKYLALAEESIDNIKEVAAEDGQERILAAMEDTQEILEKAAKALPSKPTSPEETEEIVKKVAQINQKAKEIKETLGVDINPEPLTSKTTEMIKQGIEDTTAKLVEAEIKILEGSILTEEQQKLFEQAKEDYEKGNYQEALEKILQLTNN